MEFGEENRAKDMKRDRDGVRWWWWLGSTRLGRANKQNLGCITSLIDAMCLLMYWPSKAGAYMSISVSYAAISRMTFQLHEVKPNEE